MNAMKTNSRPLMQEIWVLHHLLCKRGIFFEARYLLSGPSITTAQPRQLKDQYGENPTADGVISGDYRPIRRRLQEKFRHVQQRIGVSCLPQRQRVIARLAFEIHFLESSSQFLPTFCEQNLPRTGKMDAGHTLLAPVAILYWITLFKSCARFCSKIFYPPPILAPKTTPAPPWKLIVWKS